MNPGGLNWLSWDCHSWVIGNTVATPIWRCWELSAQLEVMMRSIIPKRSTRNCLEDIIIVELNLYVIGGDYVNKYLILVVIYSATRCLYMVVIGGYLRLRFQFI